MRKNFLKLYIITAALLFASSLIAQTSQQTPGVSGPPKGDGSHAKDTSYSISGASRNEVRDGSGQGKIGNTDTIPPLRKHKTRFTYTSPSSTNGTSGSNIAPGR
jgi:hypothetical protein